MHSGELFFSSYQQTNDDEKVGTSCSFLTTRLAACRQIPFQHVALQEKCQHTRT